MQLSVIVPAYKQAKTIKADIENLLKVLSTFDLEYELVVVVDGQVDETLENAKAVKSTRLRVFGYEKNHGKGYAVRYGMVRAKGELVAFIDAGMDINPEGLKAMISSLRANKADVVVGSKRHPDSKVKYPIKRRLISFCGQILTYILFGLNISDTQVGLKLFRRKVLEDVLPRLLVKRFAFDIELLAVAKYLGYNKILESPVELNHNFSSSVDSSAVTDALIDTLAIFYRLRILRYYRDSNKRKWVYDPDLDFKVNVL